MQLLCFDKQANNILFFLRWLSIYFLLLFIPFSLFLFRLSLVALVIIVLFLSFLFFPFLSFPFPSFPLFSFLFFPYPFPSFFSLSFLILSFFPSPVRSVSFRSSTSGLFSCGRAARRRSTVVLSMNLQQPILMKY